MKNPPQFTVHASEGGRANVQWRDVVAGRRYHIWLERDDKTFEDEIHSNQIDESVRHRGLGGHRSLDATSAKWRPLIGYFAVEIEKGKLIWKAREQARSDREAKERAERQDRAERIRAALLAYATERTDDDTAGFTQSNRVANRMAELDDANLLKLAAVIAAAA